MKSFTAEPSSYMDPYHTTHFMGFRHVSHLGRDATKPVFRVSDKGRLKPLFGNPKDRFSRVMPICKHGWPRQTCANVQSCQTFHCCQRRDVDDGSGQHLGIKPHQIAAHKLLKTLHICGPQCGVCKQQRRRPA